MTTRDVIEAATDEVEVAGGIMVGYDPADDMCPNCQTPWKCNGPHLADETPRAKADEGLA